MSKTFYIINFDLLMILLLNNILLTSQKYEKYDLTIEIKNNTELEPFVIEGNLIYRILNENEGGFSNSKCKQWIPSLINPISVYDRSITIDDLPLFLESFMLSLPNFPALKPIELILYFYQLFNEENANGILGKVVRSQDFKNCFFGLCSGISNYSILQENDTNLNILRNISKFEKIIFSFDNWTLSSNNLSITSKLYFGDIHDNFNSTEGIIGSCDADKNDPYWGCLFKKMSINNISTDLTKGPDIYYKIYFSSENHDIIMPITFKPKFIEITTNFCEVKANNEIYCNFDNDTNFFNLELIDEKMNITLEIDNLNRYSLEKKEDKQNKSRIIFGESEFFIFPLIMFKRFHVQFDAETYKISFYTTDESILQIKKDKKEDKKGSSNAGTVFLVIFIIILILGLSFVVFWFIKKRRNSFENNINKYNKFEDEENFQNMNDKRVF